MPPWFLVWIIVADLPTGPAVSKKPVSGLLDAGLVGLLAGVLEGDGVYTIIFIIYLYLSEF